jgi:hypothetical protein
VQTKGSQVVVAGLQNSVVVHASITGSLSPSALHWRTFIPSQRRAFGAQSCAWQLPPTQRSAVSVQSVRAPWYPDPVALQVVATLPSHAGADGLQT